MRNSLFFFAFILLGLANSCQKDDLNSVTVPESTQAIAISKNTPAPDVTTTAANSEFWRFCDNVLSVNRTYVFESGLRMLILSDMNGDIAWTFHGITPAEVPEQIRVAANKYFTGYTMGAAWESVVPDSERANYLIESMQTPGVVVMTDANGNIVCSGTR